MFGIGLAPKEKDTLYRVLKDKGFKDIDLTDSGLISSDKKAYHDMFNHRIMFPIIDDLGRVVAFSARIFYQAEKDTPKYINSLESAIYKKGEMLYNLNNAVKDIRKKGRVILCEGQMDVIACTNAKINEVICSLGTALTEKQVRLIKKYAKSVVICYDGDAAGIKATKKAFALLRDLPTTSVTLPNGMDPDEYIKMNGPKALADYINNNQKDFYEFYYFNAFYGKDIKNAVDYENIKIEVFNFLKNLRSKALIEKFLRRLSTDLNVSFDAIFNDYNIYSIGTPVKKDVEINLNDKNNYVKIKAHEKMFLAFIMFDKKYYDFYLRELGNPVNYLEAKLSMRIYFAVSQFYDSKEEDSNLLFRYVMQEVEDEYVKEIFKTFTEIINYSDEQIEHILTDSVKRFNEVKFRFLRDSYQVNKNDASDETIKVLQDKLDFVRNNIKNRK